MSFEIVGWQVHWLEIKWPITILTFTSEMDRLETQISNTCTSRTLHYQNKQKQDILDIIKLSQKIPYQVAFD